MPYFKNNQMNILFIHIPKTGGTSVEKYLSAKYKIPLNSKALYTCYPNNIYKNINSSLQHISYNTILKYKKKFSIDEKNIKIFTIVRNPYTRIISDLFFLDLLRKIQISKMYII